MEKVKEVVDKVIHPGAHKHDSTTTGTTGSSSHTTGTTGTHTGTSGVTGTGLDSSNTHHTGTTGTTGTTGVGSHNTQTGSSGVSGVGPHNSATANKLDPRVDSDLDGSRNLGAAQHGPGAHNTSHTAGGVGSTTGSGYGSTNAGPHDSNLVNKADPRVDSDRDGSRNVGAAQHGSGGVYNQHTAGGIGGTTGGIGGTSGGYGSTNAGPYDSNLANKADPRVDSDRDGSRNVGAAQHGPGGVHNQHTAGGIGGVSSGPGPAANTAGPHKNDTLNKLDPRVDSDLNGSKTVGGDKTYAGSNTTGNTNY